MGKNKDLKGQVFGDFTPIEYLGSGRWLCECVKCGYKTEKRGETLHKWKNYCPECKSLVGKIFGDYKVVSRKDAGKKYDYVYNCECVNCGHTDVRSHGVLKKWAKYV